MASLADVPITMQETFGRPASHFSEDMRGAGPPVGRILLVFFALLVFVSTLLLLQHYVQAPWQTAAVLVAGSILAIASIFALFHGDARSTLRELLGTISGIFGKRE